MALVSCPECGNRVSTMAEKCPKCGCPVDCIFQNVLLKEHDVPQTVIERKRKKNKLLILLVIAILIIAVAIGAYVISTNRLTAEETVQVQAVYNEIQSIGKITLSSEEKITQAESSFGKLNEKCQRHVENRDSLVAARNQFNSLVASKVIDRIDEIGAVEQHPSSSEDSIAKARAAYEKLSNEQKELVTNYDLLTQAEETLNSVQIETCVTAIDMIGEVDLGSKKKIDEAEDIYQGLSKEQKSAVTNYAKLQTAKDDYSQLSISNCVMLIEKIGDVTLESGTAVEAAYSAYENLYAADKKAVSNYSILQEARHKYDDLKDAKEKEDRKAAVQSTIRIWRLRCSSPNSAGGVDVYIDYTNKSDKTIKYATFTVVPYNAVNDVVECEIRDKSSMNLQDTGPIKPGQGSKSGYYWDCVWYNSTITSIKLTKINIEYTDGTKETISDDDVEYAIY